MKAKFYHLRLAKPVRALAILLILLPIVALSQQQTKQHKKKTVAKKQAGPTTKITTDTHKVTITQSVFYDTQALYYALNNQNAFPVYIGSEDLSSTVTTSSGNTTPQQGSTAGGKDKQPPKVAGGNNAGKRKQPAAKSTGAKTNQPAEGAGENSGPGSTGKHVTDTLVTNLTGATPQPLSSATSGAVQMQTTSVVTKVKHYKIVQSTTGTILYDDCRDKDLTKVMAGYKFQDENQRTAFINQILSKYVKTKEKSVVAFNTALKTDILLGIIFDKNTGSYANNLGPGNIPTSSPFSGNLQGLVSSSSLVNGLTAFILDRFNQEVDEAFFARLQKLLASYDELKILFPNTITSIDKIKVTSYSQSLNALRTAYQTDISSILSNFANLATLSKYQEIINKYPVLTMVFASCDLIGMIRQQNTAPAILYQLGASQYVTLDLVAQKNPNDFAAAIKLAAALSNTFLDIKAGDPAPSFTGLKWVDPAQFDFFQDDNRFKLFMGLFSFQLNGIKIGKCDIQTEFLNQAKNIMMTRSLIHDFAQTIQSLNVSINSLNNAKSISAKADIYIGMAGQFVDFANNAIKAFPNTGDAGDAKEAIARIKQQYIPLLYRADSVAAHIENKEYSAAIFAADTLVQDLMAAVDSLQGHDSKLYKTLKQAQAYYLKYGSFIAAVAESQSSGDVKNAIDAFALPVGSSRIKKEHVFSWGINSYVGVYHSWNSNHVANHLPYQETGITVPVGVGINVSPYKGGAVSMYGGVIDVGAIFTYQATTNSTVQSKIQFGQILSPSVGLLYEPFHGFPVAIGGNYQWGPKLKSIDNTGNSVLGALTGRLNLTIAIDIPIINFYVSGK